MKSFRNASRFSPFVVKLQIAKDCQHLHNSDSTWYCCHGSFLTFFRLLYRAPQNSKVAAKVVRSHWCVPLDINLQCWKKGIEIISSEIYDYGLCLKLKLWLLRWSRLLLVKDDVSLHYERYFDELETMNIK